MAESPVSLDGLIAYVKTLSPEGGPLDNLSDAVSVGAGLDEMSDALIGHFVDRARRSGASWSQIGASMGVSKQAAQKRFVAQWEGADFSRFTLPGRDAAVHPPRGQRRRPGSRGGERGAAGAGSDVHPVADLAGQPEAVAVAGHQLGRPEAQERAGDAAARLPDIAHDRALLLPDPHRGAGRAAALQVRAGLTDRQDEHAGAVAGHAVRRGAGGDEPAQAAQVPVEVERLSGGRSAGQQGGVAGAREIGGIGIAGGRAPVQPGRLYRMGAQAFATMS